MYFKNAIAYPFNAKVDAEALAAKLEARRFVDCGSQDTRSKGWTQPRPGAGYIYKVGAAILIALKTQEKILPAAVVNQQTDKKAALIEELQGYKPGRKQRREIKEAVIHELLPRALTKDSVVHAIIDTASRLLVVNAGSSSKAESVLSALRDSDVDLEVRMMRFDLSPVSWMSDLIMSHGTEQFTVDQDCDLRSQDEGGAEVKFRHHALDGDAVEHLERGKVPTRLALTFDDRISFVVTDVGHIKKLAFLDVLKEETRNAESADDVFDSELSITSGELGRLYQALRTEMREGVNHAF